MASNTNRVKLTWLTLEIMRCGHIWNDYLWPWVSLTWLLYHLQFWRHRRWFRKFIVRFRPIRKEFKSSMDGVEQNMVICQWQINYFAITEFSNCYWLPSLFSYFNHLAAQGSDLLFCLENVVPITHEQNIICGNTRLDGTTHQQTIICRLFEQVMLWALPTSFPGPFPWL